MRKIIIPFLTIFMMFSASFNEIYALNDIPYFKVVRKENLKLYGAPVSIEVKHIENVKNKDVQKQINKLIDNYVHETLKKQAEELKQSQPNNYVELGINVTDYYNSKDLTSFSLDFLEIMASSFEEKRYHTINLNTGKEVTIDNWIGIGFEKIIKDEIIKQVKQQNEKAGNEIYFMNEVNNLKINKNQSYYVNKDGQIVVTFPKYEIAPGYVGLPEFIMPYYVKEVKK